MSLESAFHQHLVVIASRLSGAGPVTALLCRRGPDLSLTESVRTSLMLGRIECVLAQARTEMAHEFSQEEVMLLLDSRCFASPWDSIAACIGSDVPVPMFEAPAPLDALLAKLHAKSVLHRIALAEVLEAVWYGRLACAQPLGRVFAVYGMPLKRHPE